jgi:hypothetical protein
MMHGVFMFRLREEAAAAAAEARAGEQRVSDIHKHLAGKYVSKQPLNQRTYIPAWVQCIIIYHYAHPMIPCLANSHPMMISNPMMIRNFNRFTQN